VLDGVADGDEDDDEELFRFLSPKPRPSPKARAITTKAMMPLTITTRDSFLPPAAVPFSSELAAGRPDITAVIISRGPVVAFTHGASKRSA
jgi:hypothetical protein